MHPESIRRIAQYHRNNGISYAKIGEILNISKASAQSLANYEKITHKRKSGPKCQITKANELQIKRYISNCNEIGIKVNCNRILQDLNLNVSRRTLNNWLLHKDYLYRKEAQKIQLTKIHKEKRIKLVSSWIHKKIEWENCVFTDEKRFSLDGPDNW